MGFFFCILVSEDSLDGVKPLTYNEGEHVSENSREIDKRSLEYGRRRKMIYTREEAASRILKACEVLVRKELIARTWGNVSARLSKDSFLITPSGRAYETLTEEDLVEVRIKNQEWEGDIKPSSEKGMHAGIYQLRPDCDFITHTHQVNASAISVLGEHIDLTSFSSRSICKENEREILGPVVPCAFYGMSSTKQLAKNVVRALKEYPEAQSALMRYHGAVCLGEDDADALQVAETLETICGRLYEKLTGEKLHTRVGSGTNYQIQKGAGGYRIHTWTPYIMEMSLRGKTVMPYLDDMAQIGGTSFRCIPQDPTPEQVKAARKGRNAIFVRGDGAICFTERPEEAKAVAIVLEKNCQAANLALKKAIPPVDSISARLERAVYLKKYAKLKDKGDGAC